MTPGSAEGCMEHIIMQIHSVSAYMHPHRACMGGGLPVQPQSYFLEMDIRAHTRDRSGGF